VWENATTDGPVYQYGIYYGSEELNCNGMSSGGADVGGKDASPAEPGGGTSVSCNKKYFNVAIGLNAGWQNCMLAFEGTTAKPGVITEDNGLQTPTGAVYPVLAARIPLWPDYGGSGGGPFDGLVCGQHPINGKTSGFQTLYTMGTDKGGFPFCYRLGTDGRTIYSACNPDYDYRAIDAEPVFGRSRQLRVDRISNGDAANEAGNPAPPPAGYKAKTKTAQMDPTWPTCPEGYVYRPELFACVGICGDGVTTPDEGCDDMNTVNGDGCSNMCRVEVLCGDGVTVITEDQLCDMVQHCPTDPGSSELSWDESFDLCFWCDGGTAVIRGDRVCDGVPQCPGGDDEQGCAVVP
jgi:cysteine-rich repeat protein